MKSCGVHLLEGRTLGPSMGGGAGGLRGLPRHHPGSSAAQGEAVYRAVASEAFRLVKHTLGAHTR